MSELNNKAVVALTPEAKQNLLDARLRYALLDEDGKVVGYVSHRPDWLPIVASYERT